jgi:hypothetical protein
MLAAFRRGVFLQPLDKLRRCIDGGRAIRVPAPADRGSDRDAVLRPDAQFVHGLARSPLPAMESHASVKLHPSDGSSLP